MSSLLNTLTKALPGADTTTDDEPQTEPSSKYRIRVTGGPSYDSKTHRLVHVNGRDALSFENEFMHVKLKVRVRDYAGTLQPPPRPREARSPPFIPPSNLSNHTLPSHPGLPEASPSTSPYFTDPLHTKDLYSISFSFTPKTTIPSLDTVWGNDFDRPIKDRLPPGFNAAFKLAKQFVDPGLECDAYSDTPWVLGPALSCWFAFRVGEKGGVGLADVVCEGGDGDGEGIREGQGIPDGSEKRRKYFLTESNRADFDFEEGRQYQADFYNSYIDFGGMLPSFLGATN